MTRKERISLLGLFIGIMMTLMVILFFMLYTSFTSLFSTMDLVHMTHAQLANLKQLSTYVNLIRGCFYGSLILTIVYLLLSLWSHHKTKRKIYLASIILGLICLFSLFSGFNFTITLNNLGSFAKEVGKTPTNILNNKYDYIISLITNTSGFASLLSRGMVFVECGFVGAIMLALHFVYFLEMHHKIVLESVDLKIPFSRVEKLLKQDEKIKIDKNTFKAPPRHAANLDQIEDPDAKTIEVTNSYASVPHYYEKYPFEHANEVPMKKPMTPKRKLALIIFLVVCLIGGTATVYTVYDKYFNFINLDLINTIDFDYAGESGKGYITNFTSLMDSDSSKVKEFMKTVTYHYPTRRTLKNGDRIKITATYSKSLASHYRIHILNASKTYTVNHLMYRFADGFSIPKKIKKAIKKDANKAFKTAFNETYDPTFYTYEFQNLYFAKDSASPSETGDIAIGVYKVTFGGSRSSREVVTYDLYTYVTGVSSNYRETKSYINYRSRMKRPNRIYIHGNGGDEAKVLTTLNGAFPNLTITKIE